MESLRTLIKQLRDLWTQASVPGRVGFVGTAIVCLVAIVGVGIWSSRPEYVAIATGLGPAEAAEIVSRLDAEGITNQMNFSGSAVMVSKAQWNRARVVLADVVDPTGSSSSSELTDSLLSDPTMNHFRLLRRKEEALARTITRIDAVSKANVHLAQPERSPFVQEQKPTTASVVLELKPGVNFSREQVAAIVALVSNSVDDLRPEGVSVLDTKGRLLSTNQSLSDGQISHQFEYRRTLEADLASKAELMLGQMLGLGRAVVRVSADVDFNEIQRTETTFDPAAKVKKSERTKSVTRGAASQSGGGATGTSSNLSTNGFGNSNSSSPLRETEEENETEYENAMITDTVKEASGKIKRLTVAAVVDLRPPETADGSTAPATAVTQEQAEGIIRQAVGFDEQRGDQINVVVSELVGAAALRSNDMLETTNWDLYNQIARNASLGIAAVVALLLGWMILRRIQPVTVASEQQTSSLSPDRARMLADLAAQARQQPEMVAGIFSNWMQEPGEGDKQRKAA